MYSTDFFFFLYFNRIIYPTIFTCDQTYIVKCRKINLFSSSSLVIWKAVQTNMSQFKLCSPTHIIPLFFSLLLFICSCSVGRHARSRSQWQEIQGGSFEHRKWCEVTAWFSAFGWHAGKVVGRRSTDSLKKIRNSLQTVFQKKNDLMETHLLQT